MPIDGADLTATESLIGQAPGRGATSIASSGVSESEPNIVLADLVQDSEKRGRVCVRNSLIKRGIDFLLAALALLFLLPLFVVVAAAIMADSQGRVFFVQRRTGLDGKAIRVIKFRTMTVSEDGEIIRHAGKGDSRVTRVGAFLRRSSIDELPQLWNVLRGDMSLVGPRPHALAHDQYYGALVPGYVYRFRARPGITGLAQVSGFRGEIHGIEGMEGRVAADNRYIDTWSIWLDIAILAKTVVVTPFQTSAY